MKTARAARHPIRHEWGIVVQAQCATPDVVRLRIALDGPPVRFSPGQHIGLAFEGWPARAYVLANFPGDPLLEVHMQRVAGGMVSEHIFRSALEGAPVKVDGPYGEPLVRGHDDGPMLLIAGGWGLAAIKSVLLSTVAHGQLAPIHVYHGAERWQDLYDAHILSNARAGAVRYVPVVETPSLEMRCRHGRVQDAVQSDLGTLQAFRVYVAGPPAMVDACVATALRLGVEPARLHAARFEAPLHDAAGLQPTRPRRGLLRALLG